MKIVGKMGVFCVESTSLLDPLPEFLTPCQHQAMTAKKQTTAITGDCYEAARSTLFELWIKMERKEPDVKEVFLVHGTVVPRLGSAANKRIDHAWVEINGDTVIDNSNGNSVTISKAKFFKLLDAVEEARYTLKDAYREQNKTGHLGPWHK